MKPEQKHCSHDPAEESEVFPAASPTALTGYVKYSPKSVVSRTLFDTDEGSLTLFAFDKGQNLSEHTAPFNAFIQVLDGESEIVIDRKPYKVKAGEMILMPAKIPHAVNAISKFKMLLTMIKSS